MRTATVRQVRHDFRSVLRIVEGGEAVTITFRNKPVARLAPLPAVPAGLVKRPDFAARLASRFPKGGVGGGTLAERIREERDRG